MVRGTDQGVAQHLWFTVGGGGVLPCGDLSGVYDNYDQMRFASQCHFHGYSGTRMVTSTCVI